MHTLSPSHTRSGHWSGPRSLRTSCGWRRARLGIGLCLVLALGNLTLAAERPVNVAILMDSSGSMQQTDPNFLRKPAAKLFISLLKPGDRASVISFSDAGYPVARLVNPDTDANRARLFAAVDRISSLGVYTNLTAALDTTRQVLDSDSGNTRRKLIVLMSDGKMDVGTDRQSQSATDTLLEETLPQLKASDIAIQTIAFTEASDHDLLSRLARDTGGQFYVARNDRELHTTFSQIVEEQTSPDMIPMDEGRFQIDPSVTEVTIVGSKDSSEVRLTLIAPGGKKYSASDKPSNIKWLTSPLFDLITVSQPPAGGWQLQASNNKNKAYVITNLKLAGRVDNTAPVVGDTINIQTWLEQDNAVLTQSAVLDSVNISADVLLPDGNHAEFLISRRYTEGASAEDNAVFASQVVVPQAGRYEITLRADSGTFQRNRKLIFRVTEVAASSQLAPDHATVTNNTTSTDEAPPITANEPVPVTPAPDAKTVAADKPVKEKKTKDQPKSSENDKSAEVVASAPPEGEAEDNSRIIFIAIYIFVSINILIGIIVLAVFLWRRHTRVIQA